MQGTIPGSRRKRVTRSGGRKTAFAGTPRDRAAAVARAVVDEEQLPIRMILREDAGDGLLEKPRGVEKDHDDGDERRGGVGRHTRRPAPILSRTPPASRRGAVSIQCN